MAKIKISRTNAAGRREVDLFESTSAPAVTDDTNTDAIVGSKWNKVDSDGKVTQQYIATGVSSGAATWVPLVNDNPGAGDKILFIEEAVTFVAEASKNLSTQLPVGAIPLYGLINYDTAVVLSTAVKIGLGTAADPDGYALTGTGLTKNTKQADNRGALCNIDVLTATTIAVTAVDTSGAAAGTVTSGTVRARVAYLIPDNLPDAA